MEPTEVRTQEVSYPVKLVIPRPESPSRWLALATVLMMIPKMILLIPHLVVLYFLGIVALILVIFAQVVVLFTGEYPESLFKIVHGMMQWQVRVNSYFFGLTDTYPPFTFE